GDLEHAFIHADVNGDGIADFIVLSGFTGDDQRGADMKARHDIAMNSIRNMNGMVVFPGPMSPPMPNVPTPLANVISGNFFEGITASGTGTDDNKIGGGIT